MPQRQKPISPSQPVLAAAVLAVSGALSPAFAELSSAVRRSSQEVRGLQQPAELIVDQWGIPHIYAGSTRDAIFLQGYNAARDRLWQIDLWRKRGLGLLAKDFGPAGISPRFGRRANMCRWRTRGRPWSASPAPRRR